MNMMSRMSRPGPVRPVAEVRAGAVETRIGLKLVADGFINPVALASPGDGSGRIFVVEQIGRIFSIGPDGVKDDRPFLDIRADVVELDPDYDERGLLGMAFHPDFRTNGLFYLYYTAPLRKGAPSGWNCTSQLVEFAVDADDPRRADPRSKRTVLSVDQPQMNHNGGHITFGPDGLLYVPLGDGGGKNDHDDGHTPDIGNGQDLNTLLGKILRIDVDGRTDGKEYGIPEDNPFVNGGGLPEIFAYGMRNPYHIAFDAGGDHALFAGDAGQTRWEEVDLIVKGGNYGWNLKEGRHCFDPDDNTTDLVGCADRGFRGEELIDPIIEYRNLANMSGGTGSVVIGGYVYRGKAIPYLLGKYVFGDFTGKVGKPDGRLFVGTPRGDGREWVMDALVIERKKKLGEYLLAIGQDEQNELYVLSSPTEGPEGPSGRVYRIVPPEKK